MRWALLGVLLGIAQAQVYNYFPPTGITYTPTGGMALGSATGGVKGAGTINAQGIFINGAAAATGTITGITFAVPSGLSISGSPCGSGNCSFTISTSLTGVLKGTGSGFTTGAVSDILGLFSGTCGATTVLHGAGACGQVNLTTDVTSTLPATSGGSGQNAVAVGDLLYGSATNTWSRLSGNTTTTKEFLTSTGTGSAPNAPAWGTISASDVPAPGSSGQVIYNSGGALSGASGLTYSAAGNVSIAAPSSGTALTVANSGTSTMGEQITTPFSAISTNPLLSLLSTAANGFATLSISGNGTIGTNDLSIFQNGSTFDASILNRSSGGVLNLGTAGTTRVQIGSTGTLNLNSVTNGGTASKYVCVDSSCNVVIQAAAC